jgi:hypothetical protein
MLHWACAERTYLMLLLAGHDALMRMYRPRYVGLFVIQIDDEPQDGGTQDDNATN